ncbi:MAG: DUF433 domain-containing protein [Planctomycetes bacterium]|nr:DUF433 domain-containing protein [Planctomycetota bacterium]
MSTEIIDRGRGPEIKGTRITVYSIWDYAREGHHHTYIAVMLGLSSNQVCAALQYIEEHKEEVLADYQKILDRVARGHPPELQAKIDAMHAKYEKLWADRRKMALENGDACDHGG